MPTLCMSTFISTLRKEVNKYDKKEAYIVQVVKDVDSASLVMADISISLSSPTKNDKLDIICTSLLQTTDYTKFTHLICLYIMHAKINNDLQRAIKRLIILF